MLNKTDSKVQYYSFLISSEFNYVNKINCGSI